MSYSEELKIIKKQRRRTLSISFFIFVILPTLISLLYYGLIASRQYVSISKFNVSVENNSSMSLLSGNLGGLLGGANGLNIHEAQIVKEFLQSQDIVKVLEKKIKLYDAFNNPKADYWAKPPRSPSIERFLEYYLEMVQVSVNETDGIITLKVSAFTPQESVKIAESIMQQAEEFVNNRSDRIQKDSIKFAEKFLSQAEQEVLSANISLSDFRNNNRNFDPTMTAKGVLSITTGLEVELAKTKTEMETLSTFLKPDNPRIQNLKARISSIRSQIESQTNRLVDDKKNNLADISQEYEAYKLTTEFALKRYATAIAGLEGARARAAQQFKYLLRIVGPTYPERSDKPLVLMEIISTLFISLVIFTIGGLVLSALRDHVRI